MIQPNFGKKFQSAFQGGFCLQNPNLWATLCYGRVAPVLLYQLDQVPMKWHSERGGKKTAHAHKMYCEQEKLFFLTVKESHDLNWARGVGRMSWGGELGEGVPIGVTLTIWPSRFLSRNLWAAKLINILCWTHIFFHFSQECKSLAIKETGNAQFFTFLFPSC